MRRSIVRYSRLYIIQAWFAYRSLFAWSTPFSYFASKFGFTFFSMLLFMFMGKFVGLSDPAYIVIGNILIIPAANAIGGVSMTVGNERRFGAMSYLLGSPAPRAPIFLGRGLFQVLDSFITVAIALPVAILIFHLDMRSTNFLLVLFCAFITAFTTSGMGFVMGSISLVNRDSWMITTTLTLALYILVGANFPVASLPKSLQAISYSLPMTRGVMAGRAALGGADWDSISSLMLGEILIGAIYVTLGYTIFRLLERKSMVSGTLDNL
jgi:ABC-2 type transport system permease protein